MATAFGCLLLILAIPLLVLLVAMFIANPGVTALVLIVAAWPLWWLYRRLFLPLWQWRLTPPGHRYAGPPSGAQCATCNQPRDVHHR